jgi:serine/threonine protein kinase
MPLRSSERPQLYSKLGSGGFGKVHRAHFRGSVVSQKTLRTLDSQASRVYLTLRKSANHLCLRFRKVAVKTIRWKELSTPRAIYARMTALNERSLLKSMKHPHIIELIDYSIRLGLQQVQLCLPYCSGGSLRSWIDDTGKHRSE